MYCSNSQGQEGRSGGMWKSSGVLKNNIFHYIGLDGLLILMKTFLKSYPIIFFKV